MSSYTKEELPILQYLAGLMRATGLPVPYIHVLKDMLRHATVDNWELETGRVLILTRENKDMIERSMGPDAPTPMFAAISYFQRAGIIQMWQNGGYRFNPDIFGKKPWYVDGKPNIQTVKLLVKEGKKTKKIKTIRVYRGILWIPTRKASTYVVAV